MRNLLVTGVLIVLLADSGETYRNKCDDNTIAAITRDANVDRTKIINKLKIHSEKIVATTDDYFDAVLSDIQGYKFFKCSHSFYSLFDNEYEVSVEVSVINGDPTKRPPPGIGLAMSSPRIESDGALSFNCNRCPDIIKTAKAYRFFEKDNVVGVYTCNKGEGAVEGRQEGFIKVKEDWIIDSNTRPRIPILKDDAKTLIDEAKMIARSFGLDIHDVSFNCQIKPPSNLPPKPQPPSSPSPPSSSPDNTLSKNPSHSTTPQRRHSHSNDNPFPPNPTPHNPSPENSSPSNSNRESTSPGSPYFKRIFGRHMLITVIPVAAFALAALFFVVV